MKPRETNIVYAFSFSFFLIQSKNCSVLIKITNVTNLTMDEIELSFEIISTNFSPVQVNVLNSRSEKKLWHS